MTETGARACNLLQQYRGQRLHKTMRRIPFLIPLTSQCTDFDPCGTIYRLCKIGQ